jgi:hypothetical protein
LKINLLIIYGIESVAEKREYGRIRLRIESNQSNLSIEEIMRDQFLRKVAA